MSDWPNNSGFSAIVPKAAEPVLETAIPEATAATLVESAAARDARPPRGESRPARSRGGRRAIGGQGFYLHTGRRKDEGLTDCQPGTHLQLVGFQNGVHRYAKARGDA